MTLDEIAAMPDRHMLGLTDYCPRCAANGCDRVDVVEQPHVIDWRPGTRTVTAYYECSCCGREWRCRWHPDVLGIGAESAA